jgi:HD-GYP domain-containing protein (c-di-GMP phosphodiesterase class II)
MTLKSGRMLESLRDIVDELFELPETQYGTVVGEAEDYVQFELNGTVLMLVMPGLWKDEARLGELLGRMAEPPALLLLGSEEQFFELPDYDDAKLWCLTVPVAVQRLRTNMPELARLCSSDATKTDDHANAIRLKYELDELMAISRAISSERDRDRLLDLILEKSRYITGADAGSVYVMEETEDPDAPPNLRFKITHNESVQADFTEFTIPVSDKSIVGNAVLRKESINIPDLYKLQPDNPWGVTHDRTWDEKMVYESHSMLTVPMINQRENVIGVIQLINKKRKPKKRLHKPQDFADTVVPFDKRSEELAMSLASQAGVSLENALLYREVQKLFDGFVKASVRAIESRDPTTSGHSHRVADLTLGLARTVDRVDGGQFADVKFSRQQLKEVEYASLLHDFGKVGVREEVLVKAKKLYHPQRDLILQRFEYIRKTQENEVLAAKVAHLLKLDRAEALDKIQSLDEELIAKLAHVQDVEEFLLKTNEPTVLDSSGFDALDEIACLEYANWKGKVLPWITPDEVEALKIPRGSLTDEEREQINSHVTHTYQFLKLIPWTRALQDVPKIAWMHHEKLDGKGYPRGIPAEEIPIQSRMMTISDIFDALTASDRPYKKAVPVEKALQILQWEVNDGKCDADLYKIFVDAKVYRAVLDK